MRRALVSFVEEWPSGKATSCYLVGYAHAGSNPVSSAFCKLHDGVMHDAGIDHPRRACAFFQEGSKKGCASDVVEEWPSGKAASC